MEYHGKYLTFDPRKIKTYPISTRDNKVKLDDLLDPKNVGSFQIDVSNEVDENLKLLAKHLVESRSRNLPIILFTGAHLIKNGLGLLLADLVDKDLITCVAGNMATSIHDFELALIGQTSEYVPQALEKGQFGMAYEFAYINTAITVGNNYKLGLGESLGKMIMDSEFRQEVLNVVWKASSPNQFQHPDKSVSSSMLSEKYTFYHPCRHWHRRYRPARIF